MERSKTVLETAVRNKTEFHFVKTDLSEFAAMLRILLNEEIPWQFKEITLKNNWTH